MSDLQKLDPSTMDLRGWFHADEEDRFYLRTVRPLGYLIPMDGPEGDMIRAQRRHGYRPAHIHFLIRAPGYQELVTALYLRNDDNIDSDTVFGATEALITETRPGDASSPIPGLRSIRFDFTLAVSAAGTSSGRVGADPFQITRDTPVLAPRWRIAYGENSRSNRHLALAHNRICVGRPMRDQTLQEFQETRNAPAALLGGRDGLQSFAMRQAP
jgi:hypothetical protein